MKVEEIIDWGQGYDEDIIEVLQAFKTFMDSYYNLKRYDDWWEVFNQDVWFNEIMKKEWEELEDADIMGHIEKMSKAIAGSYVIFDKLLQGVEEAYNNGKGLRHKRGE